MSTTEVDLPGKTIGSLLAQAPEAASYRLSESPLWDRQRDLYARTAPEIWGTSTVPHHITGNPRIANTYARLALAFFRSAGAWAPRAGPEGVDVPHVVEVGGGTGRFGYLFVRALRDLAPGSRFTYVLTDFSAERVAAWIAHPSYRPLVEEGLLDFAVHDVDRLGPLRLEVSGRLLEAGSLRSPVLGIANYVFDTLRHDGYAVREGRLRECHVAVPDDRTDLSWQDVECGPVPADVAAVLAHYVEVLDDTAVLVPSGGLRCLEHLASLTSGTTCVLVADKGHSTVTELCGHPSPSVVWHGSGFSVMVNFDFLARWLRRRRGTAILPAEPARSLVVAAFVQGALDDPDQFASWVRDQLLDTGPDNYFALRPLLSAGQPGSIESALAALRLSRHDPALLVELLPALLELLPVVPEHLKGEVARALRRVWDNYFPIGEPIDLALCVGLGFSAMGRFADAAAFLERSVAEHPDSAPAAFAMAMAHRGLRDLPVAMTWVTRALDLEPGFSQARSLRAVLADELADEPADELADELAGESNVGPG